MEHPGAGAAGRIPLESGTGEEHMTDTGTGKARHQEGDPAAGVPRGSGADGHSPCTWQSNLPEAGKAKMLVYGQPFGAQPAQGSRILEKHYIPKMMVLEKCIEEVVGKKRHCEICVVFAHNDAAIQDAATKGFLLPKSRLIVIVFGRTPEGYWWKRSPSPARRSSTRRSITRCN